jgi:hypothetical protein
MSEQTEKFAAPGMVLPEAEHNSFENIYYANQHVLAWIIFALGSATRVLAGSINAGQIQGLKVLFNLADGTREVVSFPDTDIEVGDNRKIYYADFSTETIFSVELPGFEDFTPDEEEFPIVHAVRYQDTAVTTADRLEWIAPRTDMYAHVPVGKIIALHPYAPAPDSYFFKFCDGTGTLGENFPGHEADLVPDLTDNRFLMGGTGYGVGGSNVLLDHTHTCGNQSASHTHTHNHGAKASGIQSASHKHSITTTTTLGTYNASYYPNCSTTSVGSILTGNQNASHTHSTNPDSMASGNQSVSHNHVVGTGAAPSGTSSLPQYFKSLFYLKRY